MYLSSVTENKEKTMLSKSKHIQSEKVFTHSENEVIHFKEQETGKITKKSLTAEKVQQAQRQYQEKAANL